MRPDQINRLATLEDKLIDLFQDECTPEQWQKLLKSKEGYTEKKNALATLRLVGQIEHLLRDLRVGEGEKGNEKTGKTKSEQAAGEIEREAADLEKRGIAVLQRHGKRR